MKFKVGDKVKLKRNGPDYEYVDRYGTYMVRSRHGSVFQLDGTKDIENDHWYNTEDFELVSEKTLKDLFEEHGDVWLALKTEPHYPYIRPVGYNEGKTHVICENSTRCAYSPSSVYPVDCADFILYVPKKEYTVLKFDKTKLNEEQINNIRIARRHLYAAGIKFEQGDFKDEIHWCLDYSLEGPVSISNNRENT